MAAVAGFNGKIQIGGTSTAMTDEVTTETTADTTFQITDTAKRQIDPNIAVTVKKNAVTVTTGFTINYLDGSVTFSPALAPTDTVTISGNYIPLLTVGTGRSASVEIVNELLDQTAFGDTNETDLYALSQANGEFEVMEDLKTDQDTGAGTTKLETILTGKNSALLEVQFGGGKKFRAWINSPSAVTRLTVEGLVLSTFRWQSQNEASKASFGLVTA